MTKGSEIILAFPDISPEPEIHSIDGEDWVFYHGEKICPLGRRRALDDKWVRPEPGYTYGRCKMIGPRGTRCGNGVRKNWTVCWTHGAGRPDKPGGYSNKQMTVEGARHFKHLPTSLMTKYEEYIGDPEYLNLMSEISLLDARIAERLELLEGADIKQAWVHVKQAYAILDRDTITESQYEQALVLIDNAINAKVKDKDVWDDVLKLVESRRKLVQTERKRVVDAQQIMTYQEANMLIAFLMNTVIEHVDDPLVKRRIAEEFRKVAR